MILGVQQAADLLQISTATVRNWLKSGILLSTSQSHVSEVQKKIQTGKLNKLQSRANRSQNKNLHSHAELLLDESQVPALNVLANRFAGRKNELLLAVYFRQLLEIKLIQFSGKSFSVPQGIKSELREWGIDFQSAQFFNLLNSLESFDLDWHDHLLSYLHQTMSETSQKQNLGAYYTPSKAIEKTLQRITAPGTFCDPCCGSGNFLIAAYRRLCALEAPNVDRQIFGYDKDETAVLISRANLTLASRGRLNVLKHVQLLDYLKESPGQKFDYVVTNPPWGASSSASDLNYFQREFNLEKSKDSFAFFLAAGMQSLKKNGKLLYILPRSFTNVGAHSEIRRFLLENFSLNSIELLDDRFSGVLSRSILIEVQNRKPLHDHVFAVVSGSVCLVNYQEILATENCFLPIGNDDISLKVLKEIEAGGPVKLKHNSRWGLGLVTGNNEKFVSDKKTDGRMPVLKGTDIFRFKKPVAKNYIIKNLSGVQQKAPLGIYQNSKKLLYRFICKELVFAVDTERHFTLNSANILIPELPGYSCELLAAVFNSKCSQYYYSKKFASLKVLRSQIENFPLPAVQPELFKKIEKAYAKACTLKDKGAAAEELNELVMSAYKLSVHAKKEIRQFTISQAFNG
jgi:methylase of polypeptide subunit release factors